MTALRRTVQSLASLIGPQGSPRERELSQLIAEHVYHLTRRRPSDSEIRSWDRSMPALLDGFVAAGLGDLELLVEYQLPLTSKRADVVLAGVNRRTGRHSYVVVELKQWSRAEVFESSPELVLVDGMGGGPKLHPLVQVQQYCEYLTDFLAVLDGEPEAVSGLAYLHNAAERDVADLFDGLPSTGMRLFTKSRRDEFLDHLRDHFAPDSGAAAASRLLNSKVRPSKQLMALAAAEVKEREQFVLLDEQKLAFEYVRHRVEQAHRSNHKEVIVIKGGPGSGKSAIALSLLGELSRHGTAAVYATGSKSFTETMRKVVGKGSSRLKNLFKYFNNFMAVEHNRLDVIICDEAHRIRETSTNRFTPARHRSKRPQVDELIAAARVPVFLLDEHQVVRPGEIGTGQAIKQHASSLGLRVQEIPLDAQFRCGGSRKYEGWVHRLLGLSGFAEGPAEPWTGDDRFEVRVADSPAELEQALRAQLEAGYGARMTAGFCWPWSNPRNDDTLVPDVQIGDWSRPWNVKSERSVGEAPPSSLWSTADGGFEQVGCIYTAQGFEYDWNGVIIGPDLVYRDGRLITVRTASRDGELLRRAVDGAQVDRLIRNAYKVLLTRGMVGTIIYSVDKETQEYLVGLVGAAPQPARPALESASAAPKPSVRDQH